MTDSPRRALAWLRRDLRLSDNRTLEAATDAADRAWPVFVVDPGLLVRHAAARGRSAWLFANLQALDSRLRAVGSGLTLLHGPPEEVLREFAASVGAEAVFAAADEDPDAIARDRRVADAVDLHLVDDQRILPPGELRTSSGAAYTVFTPFRRALEARVDAEADRAMAPAEAKVGRLAAAPPGGREIDAFRVPASPHALPQAGETAAAERLESFVAGSLTDYRELRDRPSCDGTSRLSPYLRLGAISVRACWRAATQAAERARVAGDPHLARGAASWRRELAWREFFAHVMHANPRLATRSSRPEYERIDWVAGAEADELLGAWRAGRTGFPLVDAGMRELVATGWMHNRARLVAASFLVKDAGIDWRQGASVFDELLLDADVQQNIGNWQWVAGVGTDAAPYFRIFNPVLQSRKFDPTGTYLRRWLPELDGVADEHLHEPWRAPAPPRGYPVPILDHADARQRALARYAAARSG